MNRATGTAKWIYGCAIAAIGFTVGSLVSVFSNEIEAFLKSTWTTTTKLEISLALSTLALITLALAQLFVIGILIQTKTRLTHRVDELIDQINVDGRSGLASYDHLRSLFRDAYAPKVRAGSIFSILMIDIVEFKKINDTKGHPVGDDVISFVGGFLKSFVRGRLDMAARYGEAADEFFLIIEGDTAALRGFTNRLRRDLSQTSIETRAGNVRVDIWASGTVIGKDDRWDDIRDRLSAGLVIAKGNGVREIVIC